MADQSQKQVARYILAKNKWAIAAVAVFAADVACVALFGVIDSLIVLAIMAVLSAACLTCALQIKDTSKTEQLAVVENPYALDMDTIKDSLPDGSRLLGVDGHDAPESAGDESFVMDTDANEQFVMKPLWADVPDVPYELPESVLPYVSYLKAHRNESLSQALAARADKQVCGLAGDIDASLFEGAHPTVEMDVVSRYSVQVTDDAFDLLVVNKKKVSNKVVFNGRNLALNADGGLRSFSDSLMCNEVDIKTVLVSSDGHLMFARATDDHPLYAGKIVPSMSCSLLPEEIEQRPVQESMVKSIHAKLRTSYDFPENIELSTSFVGFARMMPRGGAPEFYCMTRVPMTAKEIAAALRDSSYSFDNVPDFAPLALSDDNERYAMDMVSALVAARKACTDDVSISAGALMTAVYSCMQKRPTARRALRRLGLISPYNE